MAEQEYVIRIGATITDAEAALNKLRNSLKAFDQTKVEPKLFGSINSDMSNALQMANKLKESLKDGFKTKSQSNSFLKDYDKFAQLIDKINAKNNQLQGIDLEKAFTINSNAPKEIQKMVADLMAARQELATALAGNTGAGKANFITEMQQQLDSLTTNSKAAQSIKQIFTDIKAAVNDPNIDISDKIATLKQQLGELEKAKESYAKSNTGRFDIVNGVAESKNENASQDKAAANYNAMALAASILKNQLNSLDSAFSNVATAEEKIINNTKDASSGLGKLNSNVQGSTKEVHSMVNEMQSMSAQIDQVYNRITNFFSISSGIQLFKRAIDAAKSAIKDIDAAMTETAVVSNESVSSMWDKLPQYTEQARRLGSTITEVVKAQAIYVQQGLDLQTASGLGEETIKMARIANISAQDAAQAMTAALHGFNMSLTQDSAAHINDVYSKLAQNTASDTDQLRKAMSKVASIANSAGMSFENTTAFLSQIIETTQEAPETAGTALTYKFSA